MPKRMTMEQVIRWYTECKPASAREWDRNEPRFKQAHFDICQRAYEQGFRDALPRRRRVKARA